VYKNDDRLIKFDEIFIKMFFTLILVNSRIYLIVIFILIVLRAKNLNLKQKSTSVNMYTFMYLILDFCGV